MKLTVFFLFCLLVHVHATGYAQKVTLDAKNAPLVSVLKKVTKQTGFLFFYDDLMIRQAKPVTVVLKDVPLHDALTIIFRGQALSYMINDKNIAVGARPPQNLLNGDTTPVRRRGPNYTVEGRVVNASTGEPMSNVSVLVEGLEIGTVSDVKGEFRIGTVLGNWIVFSAVGFESHREKIVGPNPAMMIKLKPKPSEMQQTVVTGIFNRKASSFTGAAVTITGEELRKVGNANVFQSLKNIVPSMVLDNFSLGSNPNALPTIQLRGTSTFPADESDVQANLKGNYLKSPNEPLFILDGFEASLERIFDLDMNRIERMTILKDAASKAIYGARAANGVIVIETKKNGTGRALVTYNAAVDIDMADLSSYNLANAHEKLQAELIDGMYSSSAYDPQQYIERQQLYNQRKK
ncbi:MAG: carboxypeptidase-like regulatory domain-containing protein, partial [Pseudobacter sp.]|uniref:STN domain-containing protein n=1 Tax=Pseudobacter sp. TaxID=2045420 RepID=UPI003F7CE869